VRYKVGGLFSGVGGIELGFQNSGFDISWSNEFDKYSNETLKTNFGHQHYECDIKELLGKELSPTDVLVAGFPCQPFSIGGHRKGFDDDRGSLFFEITRIINEMKTKPTVLFFENVKNFYTHDKGNTFKIIHDILNEELGYSVFHKVLNAAKYTNIPQNRERTFIICFKNEKGWEWKGDRRSISAYFNNCFPPAETECNNSFREYLEKEPIDKKYFYNEDSYNFNELKKAITSKNNIYQWRRVYVRENKNGLCPTLTANMGTGGHNVPIIKTKQGIRKLTPKECFNLQGFPKEFIIPKHLSNARLYQQAGNSVSVNLITKIAKLIERSLLSRKES
jgi:DNA (cytosine-5)-methyltransferase 1